MSLLLIIDHVDNYVALPYSQLDRILHTPSNPLKVYVKPQGAEPLRFDFPTSTEAREAAKLWIKRWELATERQRAEALQTTALCGSIVRQREYSPVASRNVAD